MPLFLRPQRDQATQWRRLISLMSWSRSNSPCAKAQAPCNGPHGTKVFRCSDAAMESRPCACQHRLGWKVGLGTWIWRVDACGLWVVGYIGGNWFRCLQILASRGLATNRHMNLSCHNDDQNVKSFPWPALLQEK